MLISEAVQVLLLTAVISGIGWLVKTLHTDRKERRNRQESCDVKQERIGVTLEKLCREVDKLSTSVGDLDVVQVQIIHNQIDEIHKHYMPLGEIDRHTLSKLGALWELYKKKGGNGHIKKFIDDLRALKIEG